MKVIVGIDIGGTKCAITFAAIDKNHSFTFLDKVREKTGRKGLCHLVF